MRELILGIVLFVSYLSGYIVSLYAIAVFIDPDEVEKLKPGISPGRRLMLEKLAKDPRALVQIADIYKSFVLVLITSTTVIHVDGLSARIGMAAAYLLPIALFTSWLLFIVAVEIWPRYSSRTSVDSKMIRSLWFIFIIYIVFFPLVQMYRRAFERSSRQVKLTEEEKEDIVERAIETIAERAGIGEQIVDEEEKEMINRIFLLDHTVVREIMVPRVDMVGIEKSMSFRKMRELVVRDGHSRYPVYEETMDRVVGLIYVKDLFNHLPEPGETFDINKFLRKPHLIPETKIIGELLGEFRNKRQHIAIVLDEYGGVSGLVTLEDIIEEIFGEIQDEHDYEEAEISPLPDGRYLVDAGVQVEKLQDFLKTEYAQGDYDTVGGLIYDLVGSVPDIGQKIKWNELEFEIDRIDGQRIEYVKVRKRSV